MDAWQPLWLFFYNYTYAPLFVLFALALFALFNGAVALKTRVWSGFGVELHEGRAVAAGWCLILIGTAALAGIVVLLNGR